jgi:glycosyltransferase involved in cell wall biosynthesis
VENIKEVIVFSEQGDPRLISTWSNVPYFLVKNLESQGIKVNTVNVGKTSITDKILKRVCDALLKKLYKEPFYNYGRTKLYYEIARYKIKKAIKQYPNADLFIFTTFSLSAHGISPKPTVLFCDWTIRYHIKHFLNREPTKLEQQAIAAQDKVIETADQVFVLFPGVAEEMKQTYRNPNVHYNGNVINNLLPSDESAIAKKQAAANLLFIGKKTYLNGAKSLIQTFSKLKKTNTALKLDIIGIDPADLDNLPVDVVCHGYLDKGKEKDKQTYYKLLSEATVFINPTPKWGAFSASLEAMYFYTPVIVSPYSEFVKTFGEEISFGKYSDEASLAESISVILNDTDYSTLCMNAHEAAKEHTWAGYVSRLLNTVSGFTKSYTK